MTPDEIMTQIDALKAQARDMAKRVWGVPDHIADAVEPDIRRINAEIDALKVQLRKAYEAKGAT